MKTKMEIINEVKLFLWKGDQDWHPYPNYLKEKNPIQTYRIRNEKDDRKNNK
jgi:hypothetical protein